MSPTNYSLTNHISMMTILHPNNQEAFFSHKTQPKLLRNCWYRERRARF